MIVPRVLFVAPHNEKGGIGAVLKLYHKYLPSFEIVYTYPEDKGAGWLLYYLRAILTILNKLIRDSSIAILHIHTASYGSFYRKSSILLLGKLFGKKTILHIHGGGFKEFLGKSRLKRCLIKRLLNAADVNICLSGQWKAYFTKDLGLANIMVLPNPVELPCSTPEVQMGSTIQLLFFGAVVPSKGIFDLVNFLLTNKFFLEHKICLHIAGEGQLDEMKKILLNAQIKDQIQLHGWVEGKDKFTLFTKADIFILPSHTEGLPMSILEAMSFAKPIIATQVGGVPSLVKHHENGWLYQPEQINELTEIFEEIFIDPLVLKQYGKHSYMKCAPYDIKRITEQLTNLYTQL